MTEGYCKLASGIILSTIWQEDDKTRILWITMLALKDRDHRVLASVPGLASVAHISVEACRAGLLKLTAPDLDSRTKDHEGRRVAEVDGGWIILNGEKYRNFMSKQERNEYQAKLMAERRAKEKLAAVSKKLLPVSKKLAQLGHSDSDSDSEVKPQGVEAACLPEGISSKESEEAWQRWKVYYRSKVRGGKQAIDLTFKGQIVKLSKIATSSAQAIEIIENSIANSWQGLFPLKPNTSANQKGEHRTEKQLSAWERKQEVERLEKMIATHPANSDWVGHREDSVTEDQRAAFFELLKTLKSVQSEVAR